MFKGLLKQIMKKQRIHDFVYLNDPPNISHNCINAVNHSCKWDFQYMVEIARKDLHILAGKQKLKLIDRIGFIWNGTVWVDRQDKKSKNHSKAKLLKLLQRGKNLLIFPEGTWNLTPSTLSEFNGYTREVVNQRIFKIKSERELIEIKKDLGW